VFFCTLLHCKPTGDNWLKILRLSEFNTVQDINSGTKTIATEKSA